jgi:hypothetical protein
METLTFFGPRRWTSPPPGTTKRSYGLLEAGKISPSIDKSYRFTELPEAFRYLGDK